MTLFSFLLLHKFELLMILKTLFLHCIHFIAFFKMHLLRCIHYIDFITINYAQFQKITTETLKVSIKPINIPYFIKILNFVSKDSRNKIQGSLTKEKNKECTHYMALIMLHSLQCINYISDVVVNRSPTNSQKCEPSYLKKFCGSEFTPWVVLWSWKNVA